MEFVFILSVQFAKGIECLKNKHNDILWVKLDQGFFNLEKEIFLAVVYISPANSTNNIPDMVSVYSHLLDDIENYSPFSDIMIQGDFNAYTNTHAEFVLNDEVDHCNLDDVHYKYDNILPRNNLDHKRTNNSGEMLLEICKESSLRIINGRTTGDLYGKHTCITYNGCSIVDYTIVSQELLNCISIFQVDKFTALVKPLSNCM